MTSSSDKVPFSVKGKTAIITGGGSGICLCFAKLLLSKGCNVVIADLALRPEAQQVVDEYSATDSGNPRAVFKKTDVVKFDDLSAMFDAADEEFGGADLVCPGAGVFEPEWSNFWIPPGTGNSVDGAHGTKTEGIGHYTTLDINITHPIRTTQLALSRWLNPRPGSKAGKASPSNPKRVVHISSIAGQLAGLPTPLYHASKHAISGFIRSLGPLDVLGVRVNGVAPGVIKTPLWTDHPEKMKMVDLEADTWVTPEEVAERMLNCAEKDDVEGGMVMEVLKGTFRSVTALNDPGPSGPGGAVSNGKVMAEEVFKWLGEPGWGVAK
ncbi:Hypothetical protein R9X50_00611300 [Acrodontium crateriforme]|uniref:NAD-dependent 15-hydroxyprostaglandin dehydrogenase n=1 Tax=Acrodontium crateriforme TaxID=150365 RepID=A0AAQ3MAZ8_9PEZI|nr:Hypothetical protein R9X50_00611300 [Acrodontium crateriforme]